MLVGPESDEYARLVGPIADVRVLREFTHPNEDYPFARIQPLAEIMAEMGRASPAAQRVGLGGAGLIGADLMAASAGCPARCGMGRRGRCLVRPASAEVAGRDRGDPARLQDRREQAFRPPSMRSPGVTERAVAAEIEAAMRRAGAEGTGIDTIVASGPNTRPILARSTFRPIGADDLVLLTVAPRYEGYHAAIGRVVLVGNPGRRSAARWMWRSAPSRRAATRCAPASKAARSKPIGRRSWPKGWGSTSSIRACTASASSSLSRRSSGRAARRP